MEEAGKTIFRDAGEGRMLPSQPRNPPSKGTCAWLYANLCAPSHHCFPNLGMLLTPVQLLSRVLLVLFLFLHLGKIQSRTVIYVVPLM